MRSLFRRIADALIGRVTKRPPDFIVGGPENPYLLRWFLIPRNPIFNIYLHLFLRDDDDRALHDHPWPWCSILLCGSYVEHTIASGGVHHRRRRASPSIRISGPRRAHRIELLDEHLTLADYDGDVAAWRHEPCRKTPCWTLFLTGPRMRTWGFHCPERGWVPWQDFTAPGDKGAIGAGCGDGEARP